MFAVWLLARDIVGPVQALIPVLALEGIHFYNFSAVKFAHDQMQLPVWALGALFFWRALTTGRAHHWLLTGALVAWLLDEIFGRAVRGQLSGCSCCSIRWRGARGARPDHG